MRTTLSLVHSSSLPIPTGLPFHNHGETWLGLVYGAKRWFIYPPGASPPITMERTHNPFRTVYEWFHDIYPKLQTLDQPPINGDLPVKQSVSEGYRPLECVQRAGDIMYVPSGWNHLTMNIGTCQIVLHDYVLALYSVIAFSFFAITNCIVLFYSI